MKISPEVPKPLHSTGEPQGALPETRPADGPVEARLATVSEQKAMQKTVAVTHDGPRAEARRYDYVFIGAGATGGTAAADLVPLLEQVEELRAKGFSVLVLEAGKDERVIESEVPAAHALASEHKKIGADPNNTGVGTGYWVKHYADVERAKRDPKANEKGEIWMPRGAGFGGSTRMNAQVFVRVDDVDWDAIALATGDPQFRAENMKPLFTELENAHYRPLLKALHEIGTRLGIQALQNRHGHGFDGKLEVTRADPRLLTMDTDLSRIALKSLWYGMTRIGSPMEKLKRLVSMFDPNDDRTQGTAGAVLVPASINAQGKRNGARDMLLEAAQKYPDRLTLESGARAKHLVLDEQKRCTGVVYRAADGQEHTIQVAREVIVAAGATETAPLLMRSGIGPKDVLDEIGVAQEVALDGVGKGQSDRYEVGVVMRLKKPLKALKSGLLPLDQSHPAFKDWQAGKLSPLQLNGVLPGFQMRSDPSLADPDLFVFMAPGNFQGYKPGYSQETTADPHLVTFLVLDENKRPGRGTIQPDPNNLLGAPIIDNHYHPKDSAADSRAIVAGIKQVRDLAKEMLGDEIDGEVWPGSHVSSDAELAAAVEAVDWGHHLRGGAQMGHPNDPKTVVDSEFRPIGTTGIRVICASMLPDNIGSFIVSGLYQIGKLAARKIAADAANGPKPAAKHNPLSIRMQPLPKSLNDARRVTENAAQAARARGVIVDEAHKRMTDGTVSQHDIDVAWQAIEQVLTTDEVASDRHTLAHNLLLALSWQLEKQSPLRTRIETARDKLGAVLGDE